jgi:hypothetical protein
MTDELAPPLRRLDTLAYDLAWAWQSPVGESVSDFFNQVGNPIGRVIARRLAISGARAVATRIAPDWSNLGSLEDGTIVSIVGRVRATQTFSFKVADRPLVGLVLRFPMRTIQDPTTVRPRGRRQVGPMTMEQRNLASWRIDTYDLEAAHNFELVGPSGQRVPILVAGARLMIVPSFPLRDVPEAPELLDAIDLPADADADRAHVRGGFLWDEALVEVIGPTNNRPGTPGSALTIGDTDEPPMLIIARGLPPARPPAPVASR